VVRLPGNSEICLKGSKTSAQGVAGVALGWIIEAFQALDEA
jgi:hypothetical protein